MPSSYNGSPAFPASIQLPSDGDPRNASSVNIPFEQLADRTAYLRQRLSFIAEVTLTADGPVTVPVGCTHAIVEGCGGGGGGAKGTAGGSTAEVAPGGGGGGGAVYGLRVVPVTAGETLDAVIGAGGAGGTVGRGGAGGLTFLSRAGDPIVDFRGGAGGAQGVVVTSHVTHNGVSGTSNYAFGIGGSPCVHGVEHFYPADTLGTVHPNMYRSDTPQAGASGVTGNLGTRPNHQHICRGNSSPQGFSGGLGGTGGQNVGVSLHGGGPGGGGGAGAFGAGGNGGNGSDAVNAGASANGANGSAASANTGGGGGGGGGAGGAPVMGGVGGNGGNGGSGRLRLFFFRKGEP